MDLPNNSKTNSSISITSDKNNASNQTIEVTPNNIKTKAIDFKLKDLNSNESLYENSR
ncbi:MAG: hypothetical protein ABF652_01575 [Clostridium beijerinckii]|uniref:hypothetical protein n=1 Tax=Clostridium TaxID=1485 RepID=UPI0004267CF1|nr:MULTISPECIES: hypothetical protein [Clostridium]MBN7575119.1 hypothetical protein [Clostridium beijerinckii]MBN7584883.1 hypothetical protein [Clostridium beijerinckii]